MAGWSCGEMVLTCQKLILSIVVNRQDMKLINYTYISQMASRATEDERGTATNAPFSGLLQSVGQIA